MTMASVSRSSFLFVLVFLVLIQILTNVFQHHVNSNNPAQQCMPCANVSTSSTKSPLDESPEEEQNPVKVFRKPQIAALLKSGNNGTEQTTSELDFALRLRKLVLWSVREVNLRLRGQECALWWANPLFVTELKETTVTTDTTQYNLIFEIQPGRIFFESVVNLQQFHGKPHLPDDLVLVSARRLDSVVSPRKCGTVAPSLQPFCLCPEEQAEAIQKSADAREEWKVEDPELSTWPPHLSFLVPDYVTFGTMNAFIKSPVNNTNVCGPTIKLVIFVSCNPYELDGRQAIRETYGNPKFLKKYFVKLFFIFDRVFEDNVLQSMIDLESEKHDDIIQANHGHSYRNLTLRDLAMFNWLVTQCRLQNCPLPPLMIKTDDDFFVNVPRALEVAEANPEALFIGGHNCQQPVVRDATDQQKYYTPRYIHSVEYYSGYLSGATWLIRTTILKYLLQASLTTPFIPADDVYISGMLTREVGIQPANIPLFIYEREAGPCKTKQMVNSAVNDTSDFHWHWKLFNDPMPSNCTLDNLSVHPINQDVNKICFFHEQRP